MTQRMTIAECKQKIRADAKSNKGQVRGAVRTVDADGVKHDSKLESRRWAVLQQRQDLGLIQNLQRQVTVDLIGRDAPILTAGGRVMTARIDFTYQMDGAEYWEDCKGWQTGSSKIKFAILLAMGIKVHIVRTSNE